MVEDKHYFEEKIFSGKSYKLNLEYDPELLQSILKNAPSKRALDLGCGDNGLSIELAKRGFEVTLVDISDSLIKKLKENLSKNNIFAKIIKSDLDSFEFKEEWDVILFTGVSHFIADSRKLIHEMTTHTSSGGINILDILIEEGPEESFLNREYSNWKILEKEKHREDFGEMIFLFVKKTL